PGHEPVAQYVDVSDPALAERLADAGPHQLPDLDRDTPVRASGDLDRLRGGIDFRRLARPVVADRLTTMKPSPAPGRWANRRPRPSRRAPRRCLWGRTPHTASAIAVRYPRLDHMQLQGCTAGAPAPIDCFGSGVSSRTAKHRSAARAA